MNAKLILFCLVFILHTNSLYSQTPIDKLERSADEYNLIEVKLRGYVEDLEELVSEIALVSSKRLEQMEAKLIQMKAKHSFYCQAQQMYIAMDDSLMNMVAHSQQLEQIATDSILRQQLNFQMLEDFNKAERFIMSQDSIYERMLKQALLLSQVEKTAPELEKVKGHEQLIFSDVEKQFQKAKAAAESIPTLKMRQNKLEEKYIGLKNLSQKIQAMVYQPFVQRVKDKLISIAAVGIILMFINMIVTKVQGYKQIRENAKKMEEMMRKAKNDYPQI